MHQKLRSAVSVGLAVFFIGQGVLSQAAEANLWQERRHQIALAWPELSENLPHLSALSPESAPLPLHLTSRVAPFCPNLPLQYGSIRRIVKPIGASRTSTVLLIQDIHRNPEAQENIARALGSLLDTGSVQRVALEGAFGNIDLAPLRRFANSASLAAAAHFYLRDNRISGPLCALLTTAKPVPAVGVDDPTHYQANIEAYRAAHSESVSVLTALERERHDLSVRKTRVFQGRLQKFDQCVARYRTGQATLGDYATEIWNATQDGEQLPLFIQALKLEQSLNFARVGKEREALLDRLARVLDEPSRNKLIQMSAAYANGVIDHARFYSYLEETCRHAKLDLASFPLFQNYVRYVLLVKDIDAADLFKELDADERDIYRSLAGTREERDVVQADRRFFLKTKLASFTLAPDEWKEYRGDNSPSLSSFEKFYAEADARSEKMADAVLETDAPANGITVFVVGGFHTDALAKRFSEHGLTTVVWAPRITKPCAGDSAYLSVFAQEKTPLEKLLESPRLTLSPPVYTPAIKTSLTLSAALRTVYLKVGSLPKKSVLALFEKLTGEKVRDIVVDRGRARVELATMPLEWLAEFDAQGDFIRVDERDVASVWRRLSSTVTELHWSSLVSLPIAGRWAQSLYAAKHNAGSLNEAAERLIGINMIRYATWAGFIVGIAFHHPFIAALLANMAMHAWHNLMFPHSALTISEGGRLWLSSGQMAHVMTVVRSLPDAADATSAAQSRDWFRARYDTYLNDPATFVRDVTTPQGEDRWPGRARIDTSILNQSRSEFQGVAELVANAVDAMVMARGGEPIGRFGNGFQSVRALLARFPNPKTLLTVDTRVAGGVPRHFAFRDRIVAGEDNFEVSWGSSHPGPVSQAERESGTVVEMQLGGSANDVASYLEGLETYLDKIFRVNRSAKIELIRDGKTRVLNPLEYLNDINGERTNGYDYPDAVVRIELTKKGFSVADTGVGISDRILLERLMVPKSKNDEKVQTKTDFDVRYRPRADDPAAVRPSEIRVIKGGRTVMRLEAEDGASIADAALPLDFRLELPGTARITESWNNFDFGAGEKENSAQVQRVTRALMNSRAPLSDKFQMLNAWGEILMRLKDDASDDLLKVARETLAPWLRALRQEQHTILPRAPGFFAVDGKGREPLFLHERLLSEFQPEQIPGAEAVHRFGTDEHPFEIAHPTKIVLLADFKDPRFISFEHASVAYVSRYYFNLHKDLPAPVALWLQDGQTSYEQAEGGKRPPAFIAPAAKRVVQEKNAESGVHALLENFEPLKKMSAEWPERFWNFLRNKTDDAAELWLRRFDQVSKNLPETLHLAWLADLARAAMKGRAQIASTHVVAPVRWKASLEYLNVAKIVYFHDYVFVLTEAGALYELVNGKMKLYDLGSGFSVLDVAANDEELVVVGFSKKNGTGNLARLTKNGWQSRVSFKESEPETAAVRIVNGEIYIRWDVSGEINFFRRWNDQRNQLQPSGEISPLDVFNANGETLFHDADYVFTHDAATNQLANKISFPWAGNDFMYAVRIVGCDWSGQGSKGLVALANDGNVYVGNASAFVRAEKNSDDVYTDLATVGNDIFVLGHSRENKDATFLKKGQFKRGADGRPQFRAEPVDLGPYTQPTYITGAGDKLLLAADAIHPAHDEDVRQLIELDPAAIKADTPAAAQAPLVDFGRHEKADFDGSDMRLVNYEGKIFGVSRDYKLTVSSPKGQKKIAVQYDEYDEIVNIFKFQEKIFAWLAEGARTNQGDWEPLLVELNADGQVIRRIAQAPAKGTISFAIRGDTLYLNSFGDMNKFMLSKIDLRKLTGFVPLQVDDFFVGHLYQSGEHIYAFAEAQGQDYLTELDSDEQFEAPLYDAKRGMWSSYNPLVVHGQYSLVLEGSSSDADHMVVAKDAAAYTLRYNGHENQFSHAVSHKGHLYVIDADSGNLLKGDIENKNGEFHYRGETIDLKSLGYSKPVFVQEAEDGLYLLAYNTAGELHLVQFNPDALTPSIGRVRAEENTNAALVDFGRHEKLVSGEEDPRWFEHEGGIFENDGFYSLIKITPENRKKMAVAFGEYNQVQSVFKFKERLFGWLLKSAQEIEEQKSLLVELDGAGNVIRSIAKAPKTGMIDFAVRGTTLYIHPSESFTISKMDLRQLDGFRPLPQSDVDVHKLYQAGELICAFGSKKGREHLLELGQDEKFKNPLPDEKRTSYSIYIPVVMHGHYHLLLQQTDPTAELPDHIAVSKNNRIHVLQYQGQDNRFTRAASYKDALYVIDADSGDLLKGDIEEKNGEFIFVGAKVDLESLGYSKPTFVQQAENGLYMLAHNDAGELHLVRFNPEGLTLARPNKKRVEVLAADYDFSQLGSAAMLGDELFVANKSEEQQGSFIRIHHGKSTNLMKNAFPVVEFSGGIVAVEAVDANRARNGTVQIKKYLPDGSMEVLRTGHAASDYPIAIMGNWLFSILDNRLERLDLTNGEHLTLGENGAMAYDRIYVSGGQIFIWVKTAYGDFFAKESGDGKLQLKKDNGDVFEHVFNVEGLVVVNRLGHGEFEIYDPKENAFHEVVNSHGSFDSTAIFGDRLYVTAHGKLYKASIRIQNNGEKFSSAYVLEQEAVELGYQSIVDIQSVREGIVARARNAEGRRYLVLYRPDLEDQAPTSDEDGAGTSFRAGGLDFTARTEHVKEFLLRNRTFFQENPAARTRLMNRLFYLDDIGFELNADILKMLALAPESWDGWLDPDVWKTLQPFVDGKTMDELSPFFDVVQQALPRFSNPVDVFDFLGRWIKLHETLATRRVLKDFYKTIEDKKDLLGQSAPLSDDALPDATARLFVQYLRGDVAEILEERDDASVVAPAGKLRSIPVALLSVVYHSDQAALEKATTAADIMGLLEKHANDNIRDAEGKIQSTIEGQEDNVGSRELVQNARDAMTSSIDYTGQPVRVDSFIRKSTREWVRRFQDPVGMDVKTLMGPVLVPDVTTKDRARYLTGLFGIGFFTLFANYDRVQIKTGKNGRVCYLNLERGVNGLPVITRFFETDEAYTGTIIDWIKDSGKEPPFVDALWFGQDLARFTGAVQDVDILLNGRRINETMDAVESVPLQSKADVLTISLNPSNTHKRLTQDSLTLSSPPDWMFAQVPGPLKEYLYGRGVAIDLPKSVRVTRDRTGIAMDERYRDTIQRAVFIASLKLAVKLYFTRGRFPPNMSHTFFSEDTPIGGTDPLQPNAVLDADIVADAALLNSSNPSRLAKFDIDRYGYGSHASARDQAVKNGRLANLYSIVQVESNGQKTSLWELRAQLWRELRDERAKRKSAGLLNALFGESRREQGDAWKDTVEGSIQRTEQRRQLKELRLSDTQIDAFAALRFIRDFYVRLLSVPGFENFDPNRHLSLIYKPKGELAHFDKATRTVRINLYAAFRLKNDWHAIFDASSDRHRQFEFFKEQLDTALHEWAHDESLAHAGARVEEDAEAEFLYGLRQTGQVVHGSFGAALLKNIGLYLNAGEAGTWRNVAAELRNEFKDEVPDFDAAESAVKEWYAEQAVTPDHESLPPARSFDLEHGDGRTPPIPVKILKQSLFDVRSRRFALRSS